MESGAYFIRLQGSAIGGKKMQTDKPRVRQSDLFSEEIHGERVIYDDSNKKVHRLNPTMSWVWSHCDGSRTVDDLIAAMQGETGRDDARGLITSGLKQLGDANLLQPESVDLNALMAARSTVGRRAAVAAGLSIAVPMMTSIIAPTPAAAKSEPAKVTDGKKKK
jgi:hypothetical protein